MTPEQGSEWQSSGNGGRLADLEKAIASVTRAIGIAADGDISELVAERTEMRRELEELRRQISRPIAPS